MVIESFTDSRTRTTTSTKTSVILAGKTWYRGHFSTRYRKNVVVSKHSSNLVIRDFKKLRRQLQWKRHIKIELNVKVSLFWLFHVDHVVKK